MELPVLHRRTKSFANSIPGRGRTLNIYLISDTHLNHDKIKTYCDRPINFTEKIVQNWHNTVKSEDTIIHLGDVFIGKSEGWKEIYPQLPGRKILVRGNHDRNHSNGWWMEHGFDFACDGMLFRSVWLSHEPAQVLPEGAALNFHGHLHNIWHGFHKNAGEGSPENYTWKTQRLRNNWQRLFAVEYTNYMPVNFDKFLHKPDQFQARGPKGEAHTITITSIEMYKDLTGKDYSAKDTVKFEYGPEDKDDTTQSDSTTTT